MFEEINFWEDDKITEKKNSDEKLLDTETQSIVVNELIALQVKAMNEIMTKPKKGQQLRIITHKAFSGVDAIEWLMEDKTASDVTIAAYRIAQKGTDYIIDRLKKGKIKKITAIISSFFETSKRSERWHEELITLAKEHDNFTIKYAQLHCKVTCIKIGNDYYVIEGSANLASNSKIEQYLIENSKTMYDFHKSWINKIIENG